MSLPSRDVTRLLNSLSSGRGDSRVELLDRMYEELRSCDPVGVSPFDESVYGIPDLAGSVSEPVLARASLRLHVTRGGNWEASDPRDYRVATRNRRLPESGYRFVGLRLAAEPVRR